jgi:hypothetical protein
MNESAGSIPANKMTSAGVLVSQISHSLTYLSSSPVSISICHFPYFEMHLCSDGQA